jgi:hypothetical protein
MIIDMILAAISYGQLFHSGYMARGWNYILTLWYAYVDCTVYSSRGMLLCRYVSHRVTKMVYGKICSEIEVSNASFLHRPHTPLVNHLVHLYWCFMTV